MVIVLLRHFKQTQDITSFPRQAIIAHHSKLNSLFQSITISQPVRRWLLIINTFQLPRAGYLFCRRVYWGNVGKLLSQGNYNMSRGWDRTRNRRITSPTSQPLCHAAPHYKHALFLYPFLYIQAWRIQLHYSSATTIITLRGRNVLLSLSFHFFLIYFLFLNVLVNN